ncbi:putative ATP-dependent endonuclease of OLD family [Paenibacillus phyllosphaerae]|uniref:Putative ATP-dependent endonuclease of OLD family n=1 Tax=Paenibacillus phyllosphaerae TaxID=274593 RepID=A0A7W5FRZ5_9BACL|nr:AAA family ATPase [Paenibacillus phyllosphaerae]MBB3114509.1 putative ATP-dependent endonuclease of OLD family [Paenibacillus phyllosphaerae]
MLIASYIDKIINFKVISAKRNVSNVDSDKTLSYLSSKYYEKNEEKESELHFINDFKSALSKTDINLNEIYKGMFKGIIDKVARFGGINRGDSMIKIESTLNHKELLKGNTTVMYDHSGEHSLPENFNGLGYLNLISMIFEIELLLNDFRNNNMPNIKPADINLLFIEEPEAHTHPQMQYIFIKNIKDILRHASNGEDGVAFQLQTIISTHSCHITSECEFDDIKYFYKTERNRVIAKNLKDLHKEYEKDGEINNYKFLKQYLTLHRAELFFADKAIFIEGDTERILLPAMMKKIDQEESLNPLGSQNISIIEVGAYSHIFEKFIAFIGIKSLIITDIDSAKKIKTKDGEKTGKCKVADDDASITTNASLKHFINPSKYVQYFLDTAAAVGLEAGVAQSANGIINDLLFYKELSLENKLLQRDENTKTWLPSKQGNLLVIYQTKEVNSTEIEYHARSFEDAFFHLNRQFIVNNKTKFKSLKNISFFEDDSKDPYALAEGCVDKKPSFAMEILLNSQEEDNKKYCNWHIPGYIMEGLLWLKNS